jgi:uncharacterized membrane protein
MARAEQRRALRARSWGGLLGIAILAALGFGFVYGQKPKILSVAQPVAAGADALRLPVAPLRDGHLHRFQVDLGNGEAARIIAVATGEADGRVAVAFDACEICGSHGYLEDGGQIACLHCGSAIFPPSIGKSGGCNPIPLSAVESDGALVVARADLERGAALFQ